MKIQTARSIRCPIPWHLTYWLNLREIIYDIVRHDQVNPTSNGYNSRKYKRVFKIVDFKDYMYPGRWNPLRFRSTKDRECPKSGTTYAYGYIINPDRSNVLVIDIDENDQEKRNNLVNKLMTASWAQEIDIAVSSRDDLTLEPIGFHIWVGLDKIYNTSGFYELLIPGTCVDFFNCVGSKKDVVIRASKKFGNKENKNTNITWIEGYSRKDKETWLKYTSEQLIAPLTTVDGVSSEETPKEKRPVLKLRG